MEAMSTEEKATIEIFEAIRSNKINQVEPQCFMDADLESMIDGNTPLFLACGLGYYDAVMRLINHGADVNATSQTGTTPLFSAGFAWSMNHKQGKECFLALLAHGADLEFREKTGNSVRDAIASANPDSIILDLIDNHLDNRRLETSISVHDSNSVDLKF